MLAVAIVLIVLATCVLDTPWLNMLVGFVGGALGGTAVAHVL